LINPQPKSTQYKEKRKKLQGFKPNNLISKNKIEKKLILKKNVEKKT